MANNLQRTGYDYVPVPGEDYYPQGNPSKGNGPDGTILNQGTDSTIIRTPNGEVRNADKNGKLRT